MTDAELVAQARNGDEAAFGHLLERYQRDCLRFAQWMLDDPHLAEDAVQETWLRAYRALPRYHEEDQFRAWLFQILANRCRSFRHRWRTWLRRHVALDPDHPRLPAAPGSDPAEMEGVRQALAFLPERLREAFLLFYGEELSYEEMATATGASVSALKMRVKRARDLLRDRLGR